MILLEEKGKVFSYYIDALRGQFGDMTSLVDACTKELFTMRSKQSQQFKRIPLNKIQIGRFYLINYNFNGSKLFCPIMSIDYRVSNNKHILYAINLDYLPFDYKKIFFNKMSNNFEQMFSGNADTEDVLNEDSLPINFEGIYNALKDNGNFHYAISAFDILKIEECTMVSTNLLYILIHCHARKVNIALMKENMKNYENDKFIEDKLKYTIKELEDMEESFDTDVIGYYKKLKQLENNYKLFKNG